MSDIAHLAATVAEEVEPIGGNDHPMPVSVTQECEGGTCIWVICLSIRNHKTEFTIEAEHATLQLAMKNALRGLRARVNDISKRQVPKENQIQRSHGGHGASWDRQGHKGLMYMLTGEFHSTDHVQEYPGDVGRDMMSIIEQRRGD